RRTCRGLGDGFRAGTRFDARPSQGIFERACKLRIGNDRDAGPQQLGLLGQKFHISMPGQRFDFEAFRIAPEQIDRAAAHRAGRTKNRHSPPRLTALAKAYRQLSGLPPKTKARAATVTRMAIKPSTRSKSPP